MGLCYLNSEKQHIDINRYLLLQVNLGTPTQKKFTHFFVVGYDWNAVVTIKKRSLRANWVIAAGASSDFCSMKRLGEFPTPPGRNASPSQVTPPAFVLGLSKNLLVPIDTTGWREALCFAFAQEHNTVPPARSPFLEGPQTFYYPESRSKIPNLIITELFYLHNIILNTTRSSLHRRSFRRKQSLPNNVSLLWELFTLFHRTGKQILDLRSVKMILWLFPYLLTDIQLFFVQKNKSLRQPNQKYQTNTQTQSLIGKRFIFLLSVLHLIPEWENFNTKF